jgi:Glycosyltransferase family 87
MYLLQAFRHLVVATSTVPEKRPWSRSLLFSVLLSFSVALYLILIRAGLQGNAVTIFLNVWLISFLPYFVACVVILQTKPATGHWQRVELAIIFAGALVMRVMLLPVPPVLSHDSWRYVWDARVILHGYSPYVYAPDNPVLVPLRDKLIYQESGFLTVPTIYPPGAQAIYVLSYLLAPSNLFFLKGVFVGFDLATCGLLALLLTRKSLDPRRVIIYAWCPLPIVEFAIQGHVDATTITFMVLALLCASSNKPGARALTGCLIGMAALTKIYPILFLLVVVRRREWTLKQPALLLTCLATIILSYLPFYILGHGQVLGFFSIYAGENTTNSGPVPQVIHWIGKHYLAGLQRAAIIALEHIVDLVVLGAISLVVLALRLGERISMEEATLLLIGTLFAVSPHIFPWYTTAMLPWIAMLVGPLWRGGRLNGKGLAVAMAWYFTFTVLYGYYLRDSLAWVSYYALVYEAVLVGLVVAAVAEVRKARAVPG